MVSTFKNQLLSLQDVLTNADVPVLVDFYAPGCGPCHLMAKVLEQVTQRLHSQLQIIKVNVESDFELAASYQIWTVPTLVLIKNGQAVERIEGLLQTETLIRRLEPFI